MKNVLYYKLWLAETWIILLSFRLCSSSNTNITQEANSLLVLSVYLWCQVKTAIVLLGNGSAWVKVVSGLVLESLWLLFSGDFRLHALGEEPGLCHDFIAHKVSKNLFTNAYSFKRQTCAGPWIRFDLNLKNIDKCPFAVLRSIASQIGDCGCQIGDCESLSWQWTHYDGLPVTPDASG